MQPCVLCLARQAHLAPLPLPHAPIYWEWDHSLFLYPAPHAVMLADRTVPQGTTTFEDTDTVLFNTVRARRCSRDASSPTAPTAVADTD